MTSFVRKNRIRFNGRFPLHDMTFFLVHSLNSCVLLFSEFFHEVLTFVSGFLDFLSRLGQLLDRRLETRSRLAMRISLGLEPTRRHTGLRLLNL